MCVYVCVCVYACVCVCVSVVRWAEITTDGWILNNIQRVSVTFTGAPHGSSYRQTLLTSDEIAEAELAKLEKENVTS